MTNMIGSYVVDDAWPTEVTMDITFPDLGSFPLRLRTVVTLDELTDNNPSLTTAQRLARNVEALNRITAALDAASDVGDVIISFQARAYAPWVPAE
ncbi:hypothetical protein [Micromonospora carbonacea]|uniref:Uncharacterized protein n=1 Tax=Micromonospora carbonacea TaxID=47853 RepID=A0A1C4WZX5_9ACTN|nr:hypothetical protein [Micromonospora carbonacea]SCF01763.1 hypothetical protein GA0070563_104138 [Micromonospora carbonacea]